MRISELSRRGGVPVATVKFYLREGLLPPGRLTSATQAQYDDHHVERLRLVRALIAGAGMSLASTRRVLALIDEPPEQAVEVFGLVQDLLTQHPEADVAAARSLIEHWGWHADGEFDGPTRALAGALAAADEAGFAIPDGVLDRYAEAMHAVAEIEIANTPTTSLSEAVRHTVLGSVLMEPVLLAIRRLAEADIAVRQQQP